MLRLLGRRPKRLPRQFTLKLPQINGVVNVTILGGGPRGSVWFEALHERELVFTALPGMTPGAAGVFLYTNPVGRFRFNAKCTEVRGENAIFALPERIDTLQSFSGVTKRDAVRIEATVLAHWRYAPSCEGYGDYMRGALTDISRSGASLIVDREVKQGTFIEIRFTLSAGASPLVLLAEVMRKSPIETTKKISLGVRFHRVKPEEDRAIMEFINRRQAERRNRGLA